MESSTQDSSISYQNRYLRIEFRQIQKTKVKKVIKSGKLD